jgi:hypothetical protein
MSMPRSPRISRADAENLLDGGSGGPQELAALLRAAASPASAAELAGEHQALTVLRGTQLTPAPARRRTKMLKTALAQLVAAKFAATAAVAAAATGGLALAAVTGNLPTPLQHAAHSAFDAPNAHSGNHAAQPALSTAQAALLVPAGTSSAASSDEASESDSPTGTAAAKATPNPSLHGLCTAYQAGVANSHGKALDNPAFTVLITAAGGKDNVTTYCATVVKATSPAPSTTPSQPTGAPTTTTASHPTAKPSTVPSHPTGEPSAAPTHPTGPPSTLPTHR